MSPPWVPAVGLTLAPSLGGFMGAYFVRGEGLRWYASLQKPSWHPPRWTLAPIWGTLYSAMGYGSYMIWKELGGFTEDAVVPLGLYTTQLAMNWAWPPIFFGARQMGWALADLLLVSGVAIATTLAWHRVSPPAARLLYPYLAWLAFATALNYYVWRETAVGVGVRGSQNENAQLREDCSARQVPWVVTVTFMAAGPVGLPVLTQGVTKA